MWFRCPHGIKTEMQKIGNFSAYYHCEADNTEECDVMNDLSTTVEDVDVMTINRSDKDKDRLELAALEISTPYIKEVAKAVRKTSFPSAQVRNLVTNMHIRDKLSLAFKDMCDALGWEFADACTEVTGSLGEIAANYLRAKGVERPKHQYKINLTPTYNIYNYDRNYGFIPFNPDAYAKYYSDGKNIKVIASGAYVDTESSVKMKAYIEYMTTAMKETAVDTKRLGEGIKSLEANIKTIEDARKITVCNDYIDEAKS